MASSRNSTSRNSTADWLGSVERALKDYLARVSFSGAVPRVAIAYSGGLDSSMLLYAAHHFAKRHPVTLFAFHVHHGLNPHADEWLGHCEQVARSYGITFTASRVKVDRQSGLGVEESARRARYAALGDMCRAHDVPLLLTAHHQDDQAETVLLQLMRGAGLRGLSGMPAFAMTHELLGEGASLGRPLLSISRITLAGESLRLDIRHIDDESNEDIQYRRNAIRHRVAPVLREIFPSFENCVSRSSAHLQHAQRLLDELGEMDLARCCLADDGSLDLNAMKSMSGDRIDNLLRYWLARQGISLPSDAQLQQIRRQMLYAAPDSEPRYDCGELHLRRLGMRLVRNQEASLLPHQANSLHQWQGEDVIEVPEWQGRLAFRQCADGGISVPRLRQAPLVLHPRSGRERLKLAANRPSKTLKNLYQEAGLLPAERRWLPLVSLQDQLIFAAGLGMDVRHVETGPGICLHWEKL
jgi:tRNA(Ile)-lysidine synthase